MLCQKISTMKGMLCMNIQLETVGLGKSFDLNSQKLNILCDINFTVEKGDFVSIMGPSGSGKSTLLYLLGLLDTPSEGKILLCGKDVASLSDKELSRIRCQKLGFVFQAYNLVPTLSVEDNILLPICIDKKDSRQYEEKLTEVIERVGLSHRRKATPTELSGGEQQRAAIARSLINDPEIILLDEPIGNLDSKNGIKIMNLLKEINEKSEKTIIQVTHSEEATKYGTRLLRMKDGRLQKDGCL